ncbi:hypothetical protein B0A56_00830 [Flavobacterium columnare NBRC 100251 = ATCC 23463]|nr:hypothetical protein B0A56_00830 [Flavobacterium columnare NBRC 100251 = ATCC 23463]
MIFETYLQWCEHCANCKSSQELQRIIANTGVNNFFLKEYNKLECKFMQHAIKYQNNINISTEYFRDKYAQYTVEIFQLQNKRLFENAKKTTIINNYERN